MDYREELISKIKDFVICKETDIYTAEQEIESISFVQLRDHLIGIGRILDEDFEKQIYTLNVMSGVANKNIATVAIKLCGEKIEFAGYAKEGLINQHTAERAVKVIQRIFC